MERPPLVVVAGPAAMASRRRALERRGWRVVDGWRTPSPPGRVVVRAGAVTGDADAADALLVALDGAGILAQLDADPDLADRFCDDLRRLGPVEHHRGDDGPVLDADQAALVELLATGLRLGDAAAALHVSRRTADRRLAAARAAYGVTTTAALLAEHARR